MPLDHLEQSGLLLRRFTPEDAAFVREYALYKNATGFEAWDVWPTDPEGCLKAAEFFASSGRYWAVCPKDQPRIIGFVCYNDIDQEGRLDLGHGFLPHAVSAAEDVLALSCIICHFFDTLPISTIIARNDPAWKEQIAPLTALGFSGEGECLQLARPDQIGHPPKGATAMRSISEIRPFEDSFEVFTLPAARIIGYETRSGGPLGNTAIALWDRLYSAGQIDQLKALPSLIPNSLCGWTCEYDAASDTFVYLVCALTPQGTPVPDGCTFRDLPATACAKGLYGEDVMQTVERAKAHNYAPNWAVCGWNAELYLDEEEANPPKQADTPWHWLVPVIPEN